MFGPLVNFVGALIMSHSENIMTTKKIILLSGNYRLLESLDVARQFSTAQSTFRQDGVLESVQIHHELRGLAGYAGATGQSDFS